MPLYPLAATLSGQFAGAGTMSPLGPSQHASRNRSCTSLGGIAPRLTSLAAVPRTVFRDRQIRRSGFSPTRNTLSSNTRPYLRLHGPLLANGCARATLRRRKVLAPETLHRQMIHIINA